MQIGARHNATPAQIALAWLLTQQLARDGHLSIIGNDGWLARDDPAMPEDRANRVYGSDAEAVRARPAHFLHRLLDAGIEAYEAARADSLAEAA